MTVGVCRAVRMGGPVALSLKCMSFPRPKKRTYSENELYDYAVGALARRMRTVAELKRLMRARVEDAESEYGQTLIELVIRRLKDRGYLNDSQYAASFSSYAARQSEIWPHARDHGTEDQGCAWRP